MQNFTQNLIRLTESGLYCEAGKFHIDPWKPVPTAVISHAHADHARTGSTLYHAHANSLPIMRVRLGEDIVAEGHAYGAPFEINGVKVSLHPAGHILGSAQVRVEYEGAVWVFTGDYKRDFDPTCPPFEVVPCDTLITEATFALPIYRWTPTSEVAADIYAWWMKNAERGVNSLLCCYSLGKAQRILAELAAYTDRTVYLHGSMEAITQWYRDAGVKLLPTETVRDQKEKLKGELILAPPSASGSTWTRRFGDLQVAFASGWMQVRGNKRREAYDRGFVVSDHADWAGLVQTIIDSRAERVIATHGNSAVLARYATEALGVKGETFSTDYGSEKDE